MNKQDLALNNHQWLRFGLALFGLNQTKPNQISTPYANVEKWLWNLNRAWAAKSGYLKSSATDEHVYGYG